MNGNWTDGGRTIRRHVLAIRAMHIGKEANDLERQATLGYDHSAQSMYGYCLDEIAKLQGELRQLCSVFSVSQLAEFCGAAPKRLTDIIAETRLRMH